MVVAQLVAALQPYAPLIALAIIGLIVYFEAKGAVGRWGTTNRRSAPGAAISLVLVGLVGIGLLVEGWAVYGAILVGVVLVIGIAWGLSAKARRWG